VNVISVEMLSRVPAIAWWEVFVRKIGFEPGLKKEVLWTVEVMTMTMNWHD